MKIKSLLAIALVASFGLALTTSCGGGKTADKAKTDTTANVSAAAPTPEQLAMGKAIFETPGKCITCHQANGQGVANVFPNLVGSNFLLTQKVLAVTQVLNGSAAVGNKTVHYPAPMPPQLSNVDSAVAVIDYVLNSFGNKGGVVPIEDAKKIVILPRK